MLVIVLVLVCVLVPLLSRVCTGVSVWVHVFLCVSHFIAILTILGSKAKMQKLQKEFLSGQFVPGQQQKRPALEDLNGRPVAKKQRKEGKKQNPKAKTGHILSISAPSGLSPDTSTDHEDPREESGDDLETSVHCLGEESRESNESKEVVYQGHKHGSSSQLDTSSSSSIILSYSIAIDTLEEMCQKFQ